MKTVWRVVYIIYATILILVVGSLSLSYQEQLYFESEGNKALASSNEMEKFYFFYGSLGYHMKLPTMIKENDEFIIAFFEVYQEEENTLYIMLYPKYEGFKPDDRVLYQLVFNYGDDNRKTFEFDQFRNMQMYILVNSNRHAIITTKEIKELNPNSFTVIKKYPYIDEATQQVTTKSDEFTFLYTITESDLRVEKAINEVGQDDEKLLEYSVYPKHHHSMKKYSYIFYLSIVATLIVVVIGAYFLFFFRRGNKSILGSTTPTKSFKDFGYRDEEVIDPLLVEDENEDS